MAIERELTPAEIQQAMMAGIPSDREGLGAEYPKMLYRKTDLEQKQIQTDASAKCGETWLVVNRLDGLLCETQVVKSAEDEEAALSEGWDTSPRAAHGLTDGQRAVVSAKDEEIARLKAELEAAKEPKRGPGRPRIAQQEAEQETV